MRSPLNETINLKSPASFSKIQNPLTNGGKIKRLKETHTKNLRAAGVHPPQSPLAQR